MKRTIRERRVTLLVILILTVCALILIGRQPVELQANAQQPAVTPAKAMPTDQVIVKFAETVELSPMNQAEQTQLLERMSATAGVELAFIRPMSGDAFVYGFPERMPAAQVDQISENLAEMPAILYAEPDRILQAVDDANRNDLGQAGAGNPDDPRFGEQWHYRYTAGTAEGVNLLPAWEITTGSDQVVVGVIDTGILDHADLAGKTVPGYDFISSLQIANDGDRRDPDPSDPGDWTETGACYPASPTYPSSWHGSHTAGTIAAASNNDLGVAGVSWGAKILPVRALGTCGGYTSDIVDGARWAAGLAVPDVPANSNPADVLNLSLGGSGACSQTEQDAYDAITAAGTTVVVAAGNNGDQASNYSPASCDKVITVAATQREGDRAYYSNWGKVVDISAPGGVTLPLKNGVLSTVDSGLTTPKGDSYAFYQGTSMAAPHVAGVAALLIGENPGLSPAQVLQRLQETARPFPEGSTCVPAQCGPGIVDAYAALSNDQQPPTPTPTSTTEPVATPTATIEPTATNTPQPGMLDAPALLPIANDDGSSDYVLNWTGVSDTIWYEVEQQLNGGAWKRSSAIDDISLDVYQAEEGTACYRVAAFNFEENSIWSNEECVFVGGSRVYLPLVIGE